MKKIYFKPGMESVALNVENALLAGSDGSNAQADAGGIVGVGDGEGSGNGSFVPGAINGGGGSSQPGSIPQPPVEEEEW